MVDSSPDFEWSGIRMVRSALSRDWNSLDHFRFPLHFTYVGLADQETEIHQTMDEKMLSILHLSYTTLSFFFRLAFNQILSLFY